MAFFWQIVPRLHPQVCPGVLLAARGSASASIPFALDGRPLEEGRDFFALSGATAAIAVLLRALRLPPSSGVAVPLYTCLTVFESVRSAGHRCVFADIDPRTFDFDKADLARKAPEIAAVVAVHTFGLGADLNAIRSALPGRPIVEDCSHSLGSSYQGRATGLHGAGAAFSFNFHKPLSTGGGGILVANDPALQASVTAEVERLPAAAARLPFRAKVRRMLKAGLYRPPAYGTMARLGLLDPDREAVAHEARIERMNGLDRVLVARGLARVWARFPVQRQWAAEMTLHAGPLDPAGRCVAAGEAWNGYLWPVVLPSAETRDRSLTFFRRRGVDAFLLWGECLAAAQTLGYHRGDCPRAEDAMRRLMYLPCYAELTRGRRRRILSVIDEWRREVMSPEPPTGSL